MAEQQADSRGRHVGRRAAQEGIPGRTQPAGRHRRRRRARRDGDRHPAVRPIGWLPVLAVFIPIATYEVVRRLREAGYALPLIPLLLGGQAMIWLTWPYGPAGPLGAYGGTIVVCMVWRLVGQGIREAAGQLPARHLGHGAARDVGAAVRELQRAADLPGPRRHPDVHGDRAPSCSPTSAATSPGCCSASI